MNKLVCLGNLKENKSRLSKIISVFFNVLGKIMFDQKMYLSMLKKAALLFIIGSKAAYSEAFELAMKVPPNKERLFEVLSVGVGKYDGSLGRFDLFAMLDRHNVWFQAGGIGLFNLYQGGLGVGYRYLFHRESPQQDWFLGIYGVAHGKNHSPFERMNIDVGGEVAMDRFQLTVNGYGTLQNFYKPIGDYGLSGKLSLYPSWRGVTPIFFGAYTKVFESNQQGKSVWSFNRGFGFRFSIPRYSRATVVEAKLVWDTIERGKIAGGANVEGGIRFEWVQGNRVADRVRKIPERYRVTYEGYAKRMVGVIGHSKLGNPVARNSTPGALGNSAPGETTEEALLSPACLEQGAKALGSSGAATENESAAEEAHSVSSLTIKADDKMISVSSPTTRPPEEATLLASPDANRRYLDSLDSKHLKDDGWEEELDKLTQYLQAKDNLKENLGKSKQLGNYFEEVTPVSSPTKGEDIVGPPVEG